MKTTNIFDRLTPLQDFVILFLIVFVIRVLFHVQQIREEGIIEGGLRESVHAAAYSIVFVLVRRPFLRSMFRRSTKDQERL